MNRTVSAPGFSQAFSPAFFRRPTVDVARDLLGTLVVRRLGDAVLSGIIVETEAYLPENDEANHAYRGRTARNAAMFEEGGVLYVYKIYGVHYCLNFVTEEAGRGSAVLIRAVQPVHGIKVMQQRRGVSETVHLCNGPGKLACAFGFTGEDSFSPACSPDLYVQPWTAVADDHVVTTPRIGIRKAADLPLRFYVRDNAFVSRGRFGVPAR